MPGLTPLTVMPSGPSSRAKARTRLSAAALAPPSRPWPGMAWEGTMPEMATTRPARRRGGGVGSPESGVPGHGPEGGGAGNGPHAPGAAAHEGQRALDGRDEGVHGD